MLGRLGRVLLALSFVGKGAVSSACEATDLFALTLPNSGEDPVSLALALAYPELDVNLRTGRIRFANGGVLDIGIDQNRPARDRLSSATIREQFHYNYPLSFDLEPRKTPFEDPGRPRNDAFFRHLYFESEAVARQSLDKVQLPDQYRPNFYMTRRNNVSCQMARALSHISHLDIEFAPAFAKIGGSFNWRRISETDRLSAHSFGIAFDLNTAMGGYWKWSGVPEGQAFDYDNKIPAEIVATFERYGFIWGGKWHHFDGMHFEYRPELILYARLLEQ